MDSLTASIKSTSARNMFRGTIVNRLSMSKYVVSVSGVSMTYRTSTLMDIPVGARVVIVADSIGSGYIVGIDKGYASEPKIVKVQL